MDRRIFTIQLDYLGVPDSAQSADSYATNIQPDSRAGWFTIDYDARFAGRDHTQYDTTSVLRLITRKWHLPVLPGIKGRDAALVANGYPPMGDLTNALELGGDDDDRD